MIADHQTNFLFLADTLPLKYPDFYKQFQSLLASRSIPFRLLPSTKDMWAVDYMPLQITTDKFVQFVYHPDYLRDTAKWRKSISDVDVICDTLNLSPIKTDIILDGGNVVRSANKAILCNKVFKENPHYTEKKLIEELERLLEADQLIFIPTDPYDCIGHADGMVRFLDEDTVLINDYSKEEKDFQLCFRLSLHNAGLNHIEIPYNPYGNKKDIQANGIYINYLHMEQAIVLPTFQMEEDETVHRQFEELFPSKTLCTIESNIVANEGGVLNCITWNIFKSAADADQQITTPLSYNER